MYSRHLLSLTLCLCGKTLDITGYKHKNKKEICLFYINDILIIDKHTQYSLCMRHVSSTCVFADERSTYSLFHWDLIFVQKSKLIMNNRNLRFCLDQIALESHQEFQSIVKLLQCLRGVCQPEHTYRDQTTFSRIQIIIFSLSFPISSSLND